MDGANFQQPDLVFHQEKRISYVLYGQGRGRIEAPLMKRTFATTTCPNQLATDQANAIAIADEHTRVHGHTSEVILHSSMEAYGSRLGNDRVVAKRMGDKSTGALGPTPLRLGQYSDGAREYDGWGVCD